MPQIGDIQVCDAREYGHASGYVVEEYDYWNQAEPFWAIPAWEERGHSDLAAVFETYEAAAHAIEDARQCAAFGGYEYE